MKKHIGHTLKALVLAASLATLVACGNKGGNSSEDVYVPPFGIGGCSNCGMATPTEFLNLSAQGGNSFGNSQFAMRLVTDATTMQQIYSSGASPLAYPYPYKVALTGSMRVNSPIYAGSCLIPPGDYAMNTTLAGEMYYGTITGSGGGGMVQISMVSGYTSFQLSVQQAVVHGSRLSISAWILNGPGVAGQPVQCQDPSYYPLSAY